MKVTIVILTFFLLFKPVFPVIEYGINYDYISKVLCVNKAKPQMHCNGKCHLMKELAKAAENEKPISSDKKNTGAENEVLFCEALPSFEALPLYDTVATESSVGYSNLYGYLNSHSVFHPPIFIV